MYRWFRYGLFLLTIQSCCLFAGEGIVDAEDYKNNSSLQWKWAMESLEKFPIDERDKILDVGCGDGAVTALIASRIPLAIVIGLDISREMINHAKENNAAPNLIYMQGDVRKLPFDGQFDIVVALLSLNWVKEQKEALASIKQALKPGGKALITRPGKQPSNLGPVALKLVKQERWAPYFPDFEEKKHYFALEEYSALLKDTGLTIEAISQTSTSTFFKDREALLGFFRPLCNFIQHLPSDLQRQFLEEVVDEVITHNPIAPDGSIALHDLKQEVIVRKPI